MTEASHPQVVRAALFLSGAVFILLGIGSLIVGGTAHWPLWVDPGAWTALWGLALIATAGVAAKARWARLTATTALFLGTTNALVALTVSLLPPGGI